LPITRTVNGLKDEISRCDSLDDWNVQDSPKYGCVTWAIDEADKKEGSGSLKMDQVGGLEVGWYTHLYLKRFINAKAGDRFHAWHKNTDSYHDWRLAVGCMGKTPCSGGHTQGYPNFVTEIVSKLTGTEGWALKKADMPSNTSDWDDARYFVIIIGAKQTGPDFHDWTDHIVVSTTTILTITGLLEGQKIELYRSSDSVKIDTQTSAEGETQVTFDIDNEDYPEYMYLKVYATDGVSLVEVTANQRICGGDTWNWTPPIGSNLTALSDVYTTYRTGSSGTPTEAHVTVTLLTPAGAPYQNATVYFTASKGAVSPSSDVTDENGQAHTTLTSDVHGIAVVMAYWPGDEFVSVSVAYATHHILYDLEVGDSGKKFQLFIEGMEYPYATGSYVLSNDSAPQEWRAEIPEWDSTMTRRGIVSIFRKGVKEFSGILTTIDRTLADPPRITLSGVDSKALLDTRVVTIKDYGSQTLADILDDLLTSFWCGISLGTVSDYPETLTQIFVDESLGSSMGRLVCDIIGWQYRVTTANKIDVAPSFGAVIASVAFTQGETLFLNTYHIDDRQVFNSIRMRGNEDMVSSAVDGTSIMEDDLGLLEEIVFEKSITVQDTLDIAAEAELARKAGQNVSIQAEVKDDYDPGTWTIDDSVTLIVPEHDLSDFYKVVRLERDMTDPNWARVDFLNKYAVEWADLWQSLSHELKDLSAKTAI
jgi:hypothetical protein